MLKKVYRRGQGGLLIFRFKTSFQWQVGQWAELSAFLRGSRKHDTDLEENEKKDNENN